MEPTLPPWALSNRQIFILQMVLSGIVYALVARWYVAPALADLSRMQLFGLLMLPHALRHIGMTAAVTVVTDPAVPREWSLPVAYGDLLTQLFALLTMFALRWQWPIAIGLVWITNVVGLGDFLLAGVLATRYKAYSYKLGAFWLLPTFFVPTLIVTHVWMFWLLLH